VQLPEKTKEMLVGFDHKTQKSKWDVHNDMYA
jgi:hypothetical protein